MNTTNSAGLDGQELADTLDGMSTEQLRAVYKHAAKELGMTGRWLAQLISGNRDCETPRDWALEAVWTVTCEKRVFTKTGKKVLRKAYTSGGTDRMVPETTCDWTESHAAVARCLAAGVTAP